LNQSNRKKIKGIQFAIQGRGTTSESSRGCCAQQKILRDAKHKIGQGGGGIAVLAGLQEVFKKVVEAAQKVIQAVKDDEKSDGSDDDTKEIGWFHAVAN
jgi:hypothetical protein